MTDLETLQRAVRECPGDDTPRLLLADWLEENGDASDRARAEFIKVQVELAKWENKSDPFNNDRLIELRRRERELKKAHIGAWTDGLPDCLIMEQCPSCVDQAPDYETNVVECRRCDSTGLVFTEDNIEWSRGFVSSLTCSWQDWLAHADKLVWWPGATDACLDLDGSVSDHCHSCDGTGRVPRPMPPTCQPIEVVRLTTWPRWNANRSTPEYDAWLLGDGWRGQTRRIRWDHSGGNAELNAIRDLLAFEWPRVVFEMPTGALDRRTD